MENNPLFGTVFHNRTYLPPTPEIPETRKEESHFAFGQDKNSVPPPKKEKKSRVNSVTAILSIALILTLALALAGIVLAVLNYSENSSLKQKIVTLTLPVNQTTINLEIVNLREILNQLEIQQSFEIADLRAKVNQSETEQTSEIADLRAKVNQSETEQKSNIADLRAKVNQSETEQKSNIADLRAKVNQLQTEQNSKIANLRDMLNQLKTEQNSEITDLRAKVNQSETEQKSEIADLRAKVNQSETEQNSEIADLRANVNQSETEQKSEITDLRAKVNQSETEQNSEIADLTAKVNQSETEQNSEIADLTAKVNQSETEQNSDIADLRVMLNQTESSRKTQNDTLTRQVQKLRNSLQEELEVLRNNLSYIGTFFNPVSSCSDIPQDSPSGQYWIQTSTTNSPVQMYCDMDSRNCSCSTTGGWMRVANLDMTDPSQQCPPGFRQVNRITAPLRTCGRPDNLRGCVSTTFLVHGMEYSNVCGRVIGYQDRTPDAFIQYYNNRALTIDNFYVEGVSLTHGQSPRQHVWTFAAAVDEIHAQYFVCPCTQPDLPYGGVVPPFIGQDYFCDTGSRDHWRIIFYPDDPLWDGQGCGGTSTCCSFNNPPWFCKQLPRPTTDDIELRLCGDHDLEDSPLETVTIYVK